MLTAGSDDASVRVHAASTAASAAVQSSRPARAVSPPDARRGVAWLWRCGATPHCTAGVKETQTSRHVRITDELSETELSEDAPTFKIQKEKKKISFKKARQVLSVKISEKKGHDSAFRDEYDCHAIALSLSFKQVIVAYFNFYSFWFRSSFLFVAHFFPLPSLTSGVLVRSPMPIDSNSLSLLQERES